MLQEMDKEPKEEELPEDQATSIPFERNHSIVYESTSKTSTKKTSITETSNLSGPIQQQPLWNPRKSTVAPPVANKSFKGPEAPAATADNPRCGECDRFIV